MKSFFSYLVSKYNPRHLLIHYVVFFVCCYLLLLACSEFVPNHLEFDTFNLNLSQPPAWHLLALIGSQSL